MQEVGYAFTGCSDRVEVVAHQREMLAAFLEHFGDDYQKWEKEPHILKMCNHDAQIGVMDFGRKLKVNTDLCRWAVLGVLRQAPPAGRDDWLLQSGMAL